MSSAQYLEHGVCKEGLQHPSLTRCVRLMLLQQLVKVSVLLTVGQNLQAVLVVTDKLLIDVQHGQKDVKQVSWKHKCTHACMWEFKKYR